MCIFNILERKLVISQLLSSWEPLSEAEPGPKSRVGWSPDRPGSLPGTRLEMGRNGWRAKGDLPSVHPTEAHHA